LPGPPRQGFVLRFFRIGFLTVPVLALATVLWLPRYVPGTGWDWLDGLFFHVYAIGLSEEAVKFGVFVYFAQRWDSVREERDGLIQGACVALAFATAENFLYIFWYGAPAMVYRFFLTMAGHISFSALAGRAWAAAIRTPSRSGSGSRIDPRLRAALPYLLMGTLFHGFYNFFADLGAVPLSVLMAYLLFVLYLILLKRTEETSLYRTLPLELWKSAAARLLRQAERDPLDWESRRKAAFYLIYGGRLDKAEAVLVDALSRSPQEPLLRASLASLRLLQGDEEGRFALKLALFELDDQRRRRFARSLRRVLSRHRSRRHIMKAIEGSL
jgi:RsiW-degrading membrane proteinase PrsW (M82 family)